MALLLNVLSKKTFACIINLKRKESINLLVHEMYCCI